MVSARSFLVPFKYSQQLTYVLEFSHMKLRIYAQGKPLFAPVASSAEGDENEQSTNIAVMSNNGYFSDNHAAFGSVNETGGSWQPIIDGDEIYEIETPYWLEDLWDGDELCFKLQTIQHSDVLYIFSEKYPIKVLKRYAHTDWRLENLELVGGPFEAMNSTDITLTASDTTGVITLTASEDLFAATDIDRLIRLRGYDSNIKVWTAGASVIQNDVFVSDNKYYLALNGGNCGPKKPVHTEGERSDGTIFWRYLHDGTGMVQITNFRDAKTVVAKVVGILPSAVCQGTVYWELGLLHRGANFAKSGAFFRNRFCILVNTKEGPKVCLSKVGDYNNFNDREYGETTAESAITVPVLSTEFNEGKWLYAGDVLFVGTGSAEFYIDVISSSSALSNDNVKILQISHVGSKAIMPVAIGAHVFFVDKYGLSLRDLAYNYYNDGYDQTDISLLGKHLFATRIVAISYQEVPDKILWCLTGDGHLAALTFSYEQEVSALSRHDFDGEVESLAVVTNFENCCDEVWLTVKRVVNHQSIRTVEYMESGMPRALPSELSKTDDRAQYDAIQEEYVRRQAKYLDASVLFVRGAEDDSTIVSGLSHLEGQMVCVFADGAVREPQLVVDGKINIQATDIQVLVGRAMTSRYIPQPFYINTEMGSGIGEKQRIDHVLLMLYLSGGGQIGEDEAHLSDILYRQTDAKMNKPQALFTGNKEVLFNGSTDANAEPAQVIIENRSPLPMNILAIIPSIG